MHTKKIVSALALATLLASVGIASAQTTSTTTPGVPNTGAGGDATTNALLLGTSALVLIAGGAYLARKRIPQ